jgi:hypothetical protein
LFLTERLHGRIPDIGPDALLGNGAFPDAFSLSITRVNVNFSGLFLQRESGQTRDDVFGPAIPGGPENPGPASPVGMHGGYYTPGVF